LIHACEDEYGFEVDHAVLHLLDTALARALSENFHWPAGCKFK
jgi:hypothetical protein